MSLLNINGIYIGSNRGKPAGLPVVLRNKFLFLWTGGYTGDNLKDSLGSAAVISVTGKDWTTRYIDPDTSATFAVPDNATFLGADGTDDFWFDASDTLQQKTHAELIASETLRTFVKYADFEPYNIYVIGILKAGEVLTQSDRIALNKYFKLWFQYWGEVMVSGYMKDNRVLSEERPLIIYALENSYILQYTLDEWNTFFNLPANGTAFTSVKIAGDKIYLFGGANIAVDGYIFSAFPIIEVTDLAGCITSLGAGVFESCYPLKRVEFPAATSVGTDCFRDCPKLTECILPLVSNIRTGIFFGSTLLSIIDLRSLLTVPNGLFHYSPNLSIINLSSCINLGSSVINNNLFNISGKVLELTIPSALMTCNSGNPDGDIAYLISNNTVTIIQV